MVEWADVQASWLGAFDPLIPFASIDGFDRHVLIVQLRCLNFSCLSGHLLLENCFGISHSN